MKYFSLTLTMTITFKKILAREILILLFVVLVSGIVYGVGQLFISRYDKQIAIVDEERKRINIYDADPVYWPALPFALQMKLKIHALEIPELNDNDSSYYFDLILRKEYVDSIYNYINEYNALSFDRTEFHRKVTSSIRPSQDIYNRFVALMDESSRLHEAHFDLETLFVISFITLSIIAYPIRILFYIVRWAVQTLKIKN